MTALTIPSVIHLMLSLGLVLGLILLMAFLLRKLTHYKLQVTSDMKILSQLPVGTKERILLLEIGGNRMLVGVTAQAITTLHLFSDFQNSTTKHR